MSFFLAIDAGGTKTDYLLADEHRELARVRTGTIKRTRTDADTAAHHLDLALQQLTASAGVSMNAVSCTCIGTAGESVPLVADWLRQAIAARVGGDLLLLGDVEIALDAAFPGQPGIVAIAGTGSNVAGRSHLGEITCAGGWGTTLGDRCSGYWIGFEALLATFSAIDAADGDAADGDAGDCDAADGDAALQPPTLLLPAILTLWKLPSIGQLLAHANSVPAPDFSQLAPLVLACAEQGDEVATEVLHHEAAALANLITLVARRLQRRAPDPHWSPAIAFSGSILENNHLVRNEIELALDRDIPGCRISLEIVEPIEGALWRARKQASLSPSPLPG